MTTDSLSLSADSPAALAPTELDKDKAAANRKRKTGDESATPTATAKKQKGTNTITAFLYKEDWRNSIGCAGGPNTSPNRDVETTMEECSTDLKDDIDGKQRESIAPQPAVPFTSTLVQIQKGKVIFKEKKINLDKHPSTIAELMKFHEFKSGLSDKQMTEFPSAHYPLLAKLIQDSDSSLHLLLKRVKMQLFPVIDDDDDDAEEDNDAQAKDEDDDSSMKTGKSKDCHGLVSDAAISQAILAIATRQNYGLEVPERTVPVSFSIWRWEVKDTSLLHEFAERFETRIKMRNQVKQDLFLIYSSLSDSEKEAITGKSGKGKLTGGAKKSSSSVGPMTPVHGMIAAIESHGEALMTPAGVDFAPPSSIGGTPNPTSKNSKAALKEKKEQEKLAALKAKEELKEKKAKEEAKQKKEEERSKSEKTKDARTKKDEKRIDKSQPSLANFVFKIKKDTPTAPLASADGEDVSLNTFRERFPQFHVKTGATIANHNRFFKQTANSVIDEISRQDSAIDCRKEFQSFVTDASKAYQTTVSGDEEAEEDPYKRYRGLKWKLLQFQEDFRPAYFGTWTKSSKLVRGKTPWRREASGGCLNYEVDSEAEWEEDEPGEELGSEIDEEEGRSNADAADGDEMDDWMVPDDYLSGDEADLDEADENAQRKAEKTHKEVPKKKIGPLVPVVVCWFGNEEQGSPDSVLDSYRVSWMIDEETIDPFTYRQKCVLALSDESYTPYSKHQGMNGSGGGSTHKSLAKALRANGEKYTFDESDIGEFVQLIQGSVLPLPALVALTKERFVGVSKVQLELKVRQIAEKRRVVGSDKPQWVVKPDYHKHCLPGTIPELLVIVPPPPSDLPPARSADPNIVKRKAASKPAIVDPDTSPLPSSPRHFVNSGYLMDEDGFLDDLLAVDDSDMDGMEIDNTNGVSSVLDTVDEVLAGGGGDINMEAVETNVKTNVLDAVNVVIAGGDLDRNATDSILEECPLRL
ncbi:hypothetical protein BDR26DRAFT_860413 [Obelidium mucronatum]|nr:hypothetical protein BDR26DRAFT_860413 [Obelidium mucronatum]